MKNKLSYLVLTAIFLLIHISLWGQKQKPKNVSWYDDKPLHFGFSLGFNTMDFDITPNQKSYDTTGLYPDVTVLNPGINIQIVTNYHVSKYIDIRFLPGVSFGQRVVRYYVNKPNSAPVLYNDQQKLESSFLEFPLLLKFKGERLNNVRPYLIGGINFRYDLAGKKEYDDQKPVYIRLKRPDLYYEMGGGLDFYLPYFKMSIELKLSKGLNDVLVNEPAPNHPEYYNAIEKMKSQIWILAFHFE